jgi:hypothetical protein
MKDISKEFSCDPATPTHCHPLQKYALAPCAIVKKEGYKIPPKRKKKYCSA